MKHGTYLFPSGERFSTTRHHGRTHREEISGLTFTRPKTLICLYILKTSLSLGSGGTHPSFQQSEAGESFEFWASLVYRVSSKTARATQRNLVLKHRHYQ